MTWFPRGSCSGSRDISDGGLLLLAGRLVRCLSAEGSVWSSEIVQLSLPTPTIPPCAEFSTTTIPGLAVMSASKVSSRSPVSAFKSWEEDNADYLSRREARNLRPHVHDDGVLTDKKNTPVHRTVATDR